MGVFSQLIVLNGTEAFAMVYLDDIMVFSKSPEEHFEHLQKVFNRLREHGLKLKLSVPVYERRDLGFIINKKGRKTDLDKVEVLRAMPSPKTSPRD